MKKLSVGILALLFSFAVFAGTTDLDRLLLHERYGEDPWLGFGEMNDTSGVFTLEYDDADADAVCLVLDLPAGGTDVPVFLLTSTSSDYGYFTSVTVPTFALEDDDGDSYVKLDWSDDDDARLAVGGSGAELSFVAPTLGLTATTALTLFSPSISLGYDAGATLVLAVTDTTGVAAMTQTGSGSTMTWTVPTYTFVNSTAFDAFSPSIDLGFDTGAKLTIAVTDATGVTAITHSGSGPTMAWTLPTFIFTNSTSMSTFTPSWVMGFDVGAAMTVAISDTSGITVITHAGNAVTVAWTAPSFDFIGDINLDNTDIDGTFALDGTTAALTCSTSIINYTPLFRIGYDAAAYMLITTTQTSGVVAITHPSGTSPDVTWTADSLSFVGDFSSNGATASLDGSTTVDLISAARIDLEAPIVRLGFDSNYYMTFTTTQTSSNLAITHTGTPAVTWNAASFAFTGAFAVDSASTIVLDGATTVDLISAGRVDIETPTIRLGFNATEYMQLAATQTTGAVAITHTGGTNPDVTWVADSLSFAGDFSADGATMVIDGSTTADFISAARADIEAPTIRLGRSATEYMQFVTTQTTSAVAITHAGTTPVVTWTVNALDIIGNFSVDGTTVSLDGSGTVDLLSAARIDLEAPNIRLGLDASWYMNIAVTQTTGAVAISHTGSGPAVTWTADSLDFIGAFTTGTAGVGHTVTFYSDTSGDQMVWDDVNEVLEITGTNAANALHVIDGDFYLQSGSFTLGASDFGDDVTVHGDTAGAAFKWDSSDDAVELDGMANITHEDATYTGVLFVSAYNMVYTQTSSSVTLFTIPAYSYVTDVKVMTTETFDDSGTLTIDIGYSGVLEAYASDLDIKTADGWAYGDVYDKIGISTGASARDILAVLADQNNDGTAGAATVYVEWTMVAPGAP